MASLCALLGDVEITVCPGEVTSSELCQVSACTLLNARCNRLKGSSFLSDSMIYRQTGGYIDMDKYY